ncbi:hypothetical protein QUV83_12745 [Cellulomonas cellasea]|uniref:hypothetical protein n=1 Tax=Cellulomonas cellasea TaxID=43670 RepID=UPI0025A47002|nr:hypothetical protein [Cellulomonas cellasea]MDM8085636.1 hypothetical protein [Cellulomonas cellasea]
MTSHRLTSHRRARAVAAALALSAMLAACSSDDPAPEPAPTEVAETQASDDWTVAELEQAVLEGDIGTSTVLATVTGALLDGPRSIPAEVEVTEVAADEVSTLVRFTLRAVDDSNPMLPLTFFNQLRPLTADIRDVAIVDAGAGLRLLPFVGVSQADADKTLCSCAGSPPRMSQVGQPLSATFPALDTATTTISLELPGFPAIEGLPVARR